jgi:hypothetical protein
MNWRHLFRGKEKPQSNITRGFRLATELQNSLIQLDWEEITAMWEKERQAMLAKNPTNLAAPLLIAAAHKLRLKIYREANHQRPHFHLEYGREFSGSYDIRTQERLVGNMPSKQEEVMLTWARQNADFLAEVWEALQEGQAIEWTLPVKVSR